MKNYWVYILTNEHKTVLYAGITNDLDRRIQEHKSGIIPGFTKKYNVHKLVWFQEFSSPDEAIASEKKIKGWTRDKKIALIEKDNSNWEDLANEK